MLNESQLPKTRAIEKMVRPRAAQHERYPMLDLVFENLALGMWSLVRRVMGEGVEVGWEASSVSRFAEYCETVEPGSVFGIFRIAEWAGEGLIAMDGQLVDSAVEALLGGGPAISTTSGLREPTMVDRTIAGRFMRIAADELARAFARTDQSIGSLTAKLVKLESNARLLTVARRDEMVARATFQVALGAGERGGRFDLLLPYSTLEPARRRLLSHQPSGKPHVEEPDSSLLHAVLPETPLTLHAVLDRLTLSLADIAQWREGTLLALGVGAEGPTILYGEREGGPGLGRKMFVGRLGASQGRKAVRLLAVIPGSADDIGAETLP
jgi:flagellar motor switch protein FliM